MKLRIQAGEVARSMALAVLAAFRPPPTLNGHEWAEQNRVMSSGPVPGKWRSRPYQQEVLELATDPLIDGLLFVAASQGGGKTEIILNICGYYMDADASPILIVEPTLEMAEALSKDRLAKMIEATPCLREKVRDPRSRDSGNTIRHKEFPGGQITLVGANSPSSLAMRPIRVVLYDEVDRYPTSAGSEGDPVKLAEKRTFAYDVLGVAVKVYVTSPGLKHGRSHQLWMKSDKREFYVPCPDCGTEQVLVWVNVRYDKDADGVPLPETATYVCEHCGSCWSDLERWSAIRKGGFKATRPGPKFVGCRLPGMAVLGSRLSTAVEEWVEAQGNPELLKVFVNTYLCEWYEGEGEEVDETGLMARREDWSRALPKGAVLPAGVAVLTMGVDVQKDRLEYEVVGWGRGEESWSIEYGKIYGNCKEDASVLLELDAIFSRPWMHAKGIELYIRAACIDTGYATQAVYKYCKPRLRQVLPNGFPQFIFAIKGRGEYGRPVWPETSSSKRSRVGRINLWTVGVNAGKDQVMARLNIAEPGSGYCHFPLNRGADYFKGLTAERCVTKRVNGQPHRVWEKKSPSLANEPLDCRNYAYGAFVGVQTRPFLLQFDRLVEEIESLVAIAIPRLGEARATAAPAARPRRRRVRSKGYQA